MEKRYEPKEAEPRIQKFWLDNNIFKFDSKSTKKIFSIDTPPPTISGKLHMGHAMSYTHTDFIARYKKMKGFNVFFPIGFDDNGQPTERYIEKKFNINLSKTTKKEFVTLVKKEISPVEEEYKNNLISLGHTHDWSLLYKTINDNCAKIAQLSFIDLYSKDLIYRNEEPTIWCTSCKTALSQADLEDVTRETKLNYIYFKLKGSDKKIEIATTRPEFLSACVGIFVHPKDKRYKNLVGKKAIVPLFNLEVPIMKDEKVDMEFGSGIVMICTFGDKTDIEWWKIHKLPLRIILTEDGKLNDLAGKYAGMKLIDARKQILNDLKNELIKQESLEQSVGTCWRCHNPTEFLVTKQWFIKIVEHKKELIKQGKKVNWYPSYYYKRYEDWVNNLGWDWLISRQRHHGIPIPVWYCEKCGETVLADKKDLPVNPQVKKINKKCKCGSAKLIPEEDVFDTWMTSSMTPEIALNWDGKKIKGLPETLRTQAHDIIRTWAFYTIVKAKYHFNELPWSNIMVSGHALDPKGKAMHKSKGNVIDPVKMLEKYSADAMRFWAASTKIGDDVSFQEKELLSGQKTMTKLWNASRFLIMNLEGYVPKKPKKIAPIDKWILNKLDSVIEKTEKAFDVYEYSIPKTLIEQFFWKDFCDNYLEIVKYRMYNETDTTESAKYTLYTVLLKILKLFAPIMPHVTEEIYQNYFKQHEKNKSIHISKYPEKMNVKDKNGQVAVDAIIEIRKYKHDKQMALNSELNKVIITSKEDISEFEDDIKGTMRIKQLEFKKGKDMKVEVI